jgi:hypothetical protein
MSKEALDLKRKYYVFHRIENLSQVSPSKD